jgi:hypothetical protein
MTGRGTTVSVFDNEKIAASLLALVSAVIDRRYRRKNLAGPSYFGRGRNARATTMFGLSAFRVKVLAPVK